jgi:hypothetical protein
MSDKTEPQRADEAPLTEAQAYCGIAREAAAIELIARMKVVPDDKINRMTLATAIRIAREVIGG